MLIIPYCDNRSPRRLCESIGVAAPEEIGKLAKRPWNRFKPEMSQWWLVPSPAQPFYKYGKLYFEWSDKSLDTIVCGVCFEKGLDPALLSVYPSKKGKNLIMQNAWSWSAFIAELESGRLLESFGCISDNALALELHVNGGYVDEPALYDPYNPTYENDSYKLAWNNKSETFSLLNAKRKSMALKSMNRVKNYQTMQRVFHDFNDDQWLWLTTLIAVRFKVKPDDNTMNINEESYFSAQGIWKNFLSFFSHLIR